MTSERESFVAALQQRFDRWLFKDGCFNPAACMTCALVLGLGGLFLVLVVFLLMAH